MEAIIYLINGDTLRLDDYTTKLILKSIQNILDDVFDCGGSGDDEMKKLAEFFKDDEISLMSVLINGYEIKKSLEEELREYYNWHTRKRGFENTFAGGYNVGVRSGIEDALNILGIKIEGVNG
ncbi:hypothetical protein ACTHHL_04650 [Aeribacillus composti]|uniref:hypothetical protein n=1 Tax=Aeribacillus composti TaxID=1868734 RepID=UPI00406AA416